MICGGICHNIVWLDEQLENCELLGIFNKILGMSIAMKKGENSHKYSEWRRFSSLHHVW